MNKYQEALDRQKSIVKKIRDKEFVEYRDDFATLQELVDTTKTLTLEQVKKEWEALGYTWEENEIYICISIEDPIDESLKDIYIDKKHKSYECFDEDDADSISLQLTLKEHQLLMKTFRALGWEV